MGQRPRRHRQSHRERIMKSVEDLKQEWNAQADQLNQWDELGLDEIVWFAQVRGCAGAMNMLREAAKQFRMLGDEGHAAMCDAHADAISNATGSAS
jgi:hypothetical protein